MSKVTKNVIIFALLVLLFAGAYIAGEHFGSNTAPNMADDQTGNDSHTADEVVIVDETEPSDGSGNGSIVITQQKVPYPLEVDFSPVLLKEAQSEKKLVIMTQEATSPEKAQKAGLFNLPVFRQTKAIIFHGEGTFFVDLSSLSSSDFIIDKENMNINILIPKPQLSVRLLPEKTEFFDSSNGFLRFGEMEITPEAMTKLQEQGIKKIEAVLNSNRNAWKTAERFAKLSVKEIYEPIIAAQIDSALQYTDDIFAIPPRYTITVAIKDS